MSDRTPNDELVFTVTQLHPELDSGNTDWYAREIAYQSPTGLADDSRAVYLKVLEVGSKKDLLWARKEIKKAYPKVHQGSFSR